MSFQFSCGSGTAVIDTMCSARSSKTRIGVAPGASTGIHRSALASRCALLGSPNQSVGTRASPAAA
jgi:hypothetical protein